MVYILPERLPALVRPAFGMTFPPQVGARTLQLSKLREKAYYLHMRRLFPKMRLLFTDTDSVMVQIFELHDPLHAMAEANLNGAALFDVAGPERDLSTLSAAAHAKQFLDPVVPLVPCTGIFLGPSKSGKTVALIHKPDWSNTGACLRESTSSVRPLPSTVDGWIPVKKYIEEDLGVNTEREQA